MLTGIILAISRIAGETAPLIMTMLGTTLFFTSLTGPVDALPLRIWRLASQPYESAHVGGGCPCSDTPSPQHERDSEAASTKKRILNKNDDRRWVKSDYIVYVIYICNK